MRTSFLISCFFTSCFFLASNAFAAPHTMHNVTTTDGEWSGRIVITSANEDAFLTDSQGKNMGMVYDFNLKTASPFVYGFGFNSGTDFDVSYVITLYQSSNNALSHRVGFESKACQFNVSAKGPANPDIRVEEYNGAHCAYTVVPGRGEDFTVN